MSNQLFNTLNSLSATREASGPLEIAQGVGMHFERFKKADAVLRSALQQEYGTDPAIEEPSTGEAVVVPIEQLRQARVRRLAGSTGEVALHRNEADSKAEVVRGVIDRSREVSAAARKVRAVRNTEAAGEMPKVVALDEYRTKRPILGALGSNTVLANMLGLKEAA